MSLDPAGSAPEMPTLDPELNPTVPLTGCVVEPVGSVRSGFVGVPITLVPSVISCCQVPLCDDDTGQDELPGVP
jgi:hypothetical protein